jgi:hypothetical protein
MDIRIQILDTLKIDRKRKRMDAGKNRSGNILLELCRGNNLFIVNSRIGDDYLESGRLTCRNSSVVDYYICSPCFFEYFCNFKVVDFSLQSSSKILPDLFLPASILFLFRSIFSVSKIAKSFSTNWVKDNILLELCRGNNLFIVNGRIGDDYLESGRLTCRNSSVVERPLLFV